MSSVTLRNTRFPAGTSVGAYPRSAWGGVSSPEGAPSGAALETKTVGSDSSLTFTTLTDGTTYYAWANVGGQDVIVGFRPGATRPSRSSRYSEGDWSGSKVPVWNPATGQWDPGTTSTGGGVTQTPGSSGHPSLLAPANLQSVAGSSAMTANQVRGVRARAGKAGTLANLYICVNAASGNLAAGVYTSDQPRALLWSSGTIVTPTGPGWVSVGAPNIALTQGQEVDLVVQPDNATATFYRYSVANTALVLLPNPSMLDGAGQAYLMWQLTLGAMGLPATIDDTTVTVTGSVVAIAGRIV